MSRFDEFWSAWPENGEPPFQENTRKKNRAGCEKKWKLMKLDVIADEIIGDVKKRSLYDKQWRENHGKFMQGPLPYLNQRNWESKFADWRDDKKASTGNGGGINLNNVVDWIIQNKRLTPDQVTSKWQWLSDGSKVIGVQIPNMPPFMFKSHTEATRGTSETDNQAA